MKRRSFLVVLSVLVWGCSGSTPPGVDGTDASKYELGKAIASGDESTVTKILDANPDAVNQPDPSGQFPLHYAAQANNAEMVKLLLDRGADPSVRNADDEPPIIAARDAGASDEVMQLLQPGSGGQSAPQSGGGGGSL